MTWVGAEPGVGGRQACPRCAGVRSGAQAPGQRLRHAGPARNVRQAIPTAPIGRPAAAAGRRTPSTRTTPLTAPRTPRHTALALSLDGVLAYSVRREAATDLTVSMAAGGGSAVCCSAAASRPGPA